MDKVWAVMFYDGTDNTGELFAIYKTEIGSIQAIIKDMENIARCKGWNFGSTEIDIILNTFKIEDAISTLDVFAGHDDVPDYTYYIEKYSVEE